MKEKIKRLSTTYTLQFLHPYLWPKLSRHWYIWKVFKKRIFQYHNIFEYFVKSCQTRQALKLLLIGGIFLTFYLAFAALLQCFIHQIYTWTFVRQIKTLVALYKLKPLQNLTWGNIFSPASDGSSLYTITNIEVVYLLYIYTSFPTLWLGTDHLTCRFFVSFRNFFRTTPVRIFNFFVAFQNLTLGYMTKTLNQIFFFLHQNQNIFFSNIENQNIFLEINQSGRLFISLALGRYEDLFEWNTAIWSMTHGTVSTDYIYSCYNLHSGIIYIYFPCIRKIWRFVHPRKVIFPEGNALGKYDYFEGEQIHISLMQGKWMFYSTRPTFWWILNSFQDMCFRMSYVFVSSILFWFPHCTRYFWRVFRFLFLERKQDSNVTSEPYFL